MIKRFMNPDANSNNTRVVHAKESGCCPELKNCLYEIDITGTVSVEGMKIEDKNGVTLTKPWGWTANPAVVKTNILNALADWGYDVTREGVEYPAGDGVEVVDTGGGNLNIKIFGDVVAVAMINNETDLPFTKKCDQGAEYTCSFTVADDTQVGTLAYAGTTATVGDASGYGSGETATFKTNLETALGTLGIAFNSVAVTNSAGIHTVVLKLVDVQCSLLTIGGISSNQDAVKPNFTA